MKTVEFKDVQPGQKFIKKGITYVKKNSSVATCPQLFGKREVPFNRNIKVKVMHNGKGDNYK